MLSRFVENDKRYKRALRAEETESILRTHIRLKAILGLLSQKMYHQPLSDLTPDQFEHVLRMQQTNAARALAEQLKITEADMRIWPKNRCFMICVYRIWRFATASCMPEEQRSCR